MLFKLPTRGQKGIAKRNVHVFVMRVIGDDVGARHRHVDTDDEMLALDLVMVRLIDHHSATGDVWMKFLELLGLFADQLLECRGDSHSTEVDLQGGSHRSSFRALGATKKPVTAGRLSSHPTANSSPTGQPASGPFLAQNMPSLTV